MEYTGGIGVEHIASEIGALGRRKRAVGYEELITALCKRFKVSRYQAIIGIEYGIEVGSLRIENGSVSLVRNQ